MDRELRATEDDVMANVEKEIRESAQMLEEDRLNFGLVQVVYEWSRNKVSHNQIDQHFCCSDLFDDIFNTRKLVFESFFSCSFYF